MDLNDPWYARQQAERAWRRHAGVGRGPLAPAPSRRRSDIEVAHAAHSHPATDDTAWVRQEVLRSWARSSVHLTPDRREAPLVAEDRARERWQHSPLRRAVAVLQEELDRVVDDGRFIAAITGSDGTILWTHGSTWMRDRAAQVHFVPGGRWDEPSMGTNAMSMALQTGRAAQVFSAEHFSAAIHDWVCYSAPIHELGSGRILGVLDLSTSWDRAQPLGLTSAKLLASNLSLLLATFQGRTPGERPGQAEGHEGLELQLLGRPRVRLDGREVTLPRRQLELLAVLSLHPHGLTLEALHAALHPDHTVQPATVKAEVSHLRRALGAEAISSRPYRLTVPVRADHLDVLNDIAAGRLGVALSAYGGALLDGTDAPALQDHGRYLEAALRRAVVTADDADLLFALGGRLPDEVEVHQRCLDRLAQDDPRAAIVHGRLVAALS